jgi:competence protein ComEA
MKTFLIGILLILFGILISGLISLTTAPPRGEPVILLPPPTPLPVVVYITGAVANPGVVVIPPGSRIQDAISAAGGVLPDADLSRTNLAAPVDDGSQITIPAILVNSPTQSNSSLSTLVNVNTALQDELAALPGIGPVTAQRIVEYRAQFGPFTTLEDLTQVFGIGPATLEQIRELVTVDP